MKNYLSLNKWRSLGYLTLILMAILIVGYTSSIATTEVSSDVAPAVPAVSATATPASAFARNDVAVPDEDVNVPTYIDELDAVFVQYFKLMRQVSDAAGDLLLGDVSTQQKAISDVGETAVAMQAVLDEARRIEVPEDEKAQETHDALLAWMDAVYAFSNDIAAGEIREVEPMAEQRTHNVALQVRYLKQRDALTSGQAWLMEIRAQVGLDEE